MIKEGGAALDTVNCPISITFSSIGAGWAKARLHIGNDDFVFPISYLEDGIDALIERIYYLSSMLGHDDYNSDLMEYGEAEITSVIDGEEATRHWIEIPWKTTTMVWDGEPLFVRLEFERPLNHDSNFDVLITLDVYQEEHSKYNYTVRYRDLCYAAAKAITDLITEYGLIGVYESTWMPDINLRHFLTIKEIALDMPLKKAYDSEYAVHTSIEDELKLLLKPM